MKRVELEAPSVGRQLVKHAARVVVIKRKKIKKKKLIKRVRKNWHQIKKRNEAKAKADEADFREKMYVKLSDALNFSPEDHVKDIIGKVKQPPPQVTITGKKKYPHWKDVMTIEELYGIPPSLHIDKSACIPDEEDLEQIKELKEKYEKTFRKVDKSDQ